MKVLELGKNAKENWNLKTKCTGNGNRDKGCNSILLVEYDDLRYFEGQEYPWRIQPAAVCFKCPVCNAVTDLEKTEWPTDVRNITAWAFDWHYRENMQ
jgi:hypothetical protein